MSVQRIRQDMEPRRRVCSSRPTAGLVGLRPTERSFLVLQRTAGNRAVGSVLAADRGHPVPTGERVPATRLGGGGGWASPAQTAHGRAVAHPGVGRAAIVQRLFHPHRVTAKTHLREMGGGGGVDTGKKTGRSLPKGAEVVVDPARTVRQRRAIARDVTWARAVDTTGAAWDPIADPGAGGYVRLTKVAPATYPQPERLTIPSLGDFDLDRNFHEHVGEYVTFEHSHQTRTDWIVRARPGFRRMDTNHFLHDLTPTEKLQINRKEAAKDRLRELLTQAAVRYHLDPALLTKDANLEKGDGGGLIKPLRLEIGTQTEQERDRWQEWSQNVFAKLATGADQMAASIDHWRASIYPADSTRCTVSQVDIDGSDLHDRGLGAVMVTYDKPNDGIGMFPGVATAKVVVKPEDRSLEKAMFAAKPTSLANRVNTHVGLAGGDAIATLKMKTHAAYGSLVEFVSGQQAKAVAGGGGDSQAMSEGMAFALLAGMSDVHQENVIYVGTKPYFIDADNSLNAKRITDPGGAGNQSGFTRWNANQAATDYDAMRDIAAIRADSTHTRSRLMRALVADATPLIDAVRATFTGKRGRVVPLYTQTWANALKRDGYITSPVGAPTDRPSPTAAITRWLIVNMLTQRLPAGAQDLGPGLAGEAGRHSGGDHFAAQEAATEVKADLDQGKIPFFEYEYSTGHVLQNGRVIWNGQTLDDAMDALAARYQPPPPVVVPRDAPIGDDTW